MRQLPLQHANHEDPPEINLRATRVKAALGPEAFAACIFECLRVDPRSGRAACVMAGVSPEALRMGQVEYGGAVEVSKDMTAVSCAPMLSQTSATIGRTSSNYSEVG